MGSRGPIQRPTSIRGERRRRKPPAEVMGERPPMPDWLPEGAKSLWRRLLPRILAANVPLRMADSEAVAMYVLSVHNAQTSARAAERSETTTLERLKHLRLSARFGKDALAWAGVIGATPAARARLGIRAEKPKDPDNPWLLLGPKLKFGSDAELRKKYPNVRWTSGDDAA